MATAEKTEPRAYRGDWLGDHYPLETRYGRVTIQPLGWGLRVESRRDVEWVDGKQIAREDPPLVIFGRESRLGWADYQINRHGELGEPGTIYGGNLTLVGEMKMRAELRPLVAAWLAEHAEEFDRTREAYVSNNARTCEESIRELEDALEVYRGRLAAIEAGDLDVSPYLNGGRGLLVGGED
jgi:hypothetical protein